MHPALHSAQEGRREGSAYKGSLPTDQEIFVFCCPAKCCPSSSACSEATPISSGGSGRELFDHSLPRTLWRIRCIQRIGIDPICSCSHMGCQCSRGFVWSSGAHEPVDGGDRTSLHGLKQVGLCLQDDAVGGTTCPTLELQELRIRSSGEGICAFSPTGMGDHCLGILQRNGRCVFQAVRSCPSEEKPSASSAVAAITPKEKVPEGKTALWSDRGAVAQSGGGGPGDGTGGPWPGFAGDGLLDLGIGLCC